MLLLVLSVGVIYLAMIGVLLVGWHRVHTQPCHHTDSGLRVSVVVPFRNEAQQLPYLLNALRKQTYPQLEFLMVDDHSTDESVALIDVIAEGDKRFRILGNPGEGKKTAITAAVRAASGEIIMTTDADCVMPAGWIDSLIKGFENDRVMMVMGAVVLDHNSTFFGKLQQMEFVSLIGSAAAGIGLRSPFMCNGANLAYRKVAFETVGGYQDNQQVASGDDEFLMRAIAHQYPNSIQFQVDRNSIVTTAASATVMEFWFQRLRWASKWKHNSWVVKMLALGVIMFHTVFIGCMVMLVVGDSNLRLAAAGVLCAKLLAEWALIKPIMGYWGLRWNAGVFVTLQIVHSFYIVITGLFSNFMPNTWKGRPIRY